MRRFALVSALAAAAALITHAAPLQAHQRIITIHNDTGFDIVEFYSTIVRSVSRSPRYSSIMGPNESRTTLAASA